MNKTSLFFLFSFLLLSNISLIQASESTGLEIAKIAEAKNNGYLGELSQMEMTLIDAFGNKTKRVLTAQILEVEGDGDKTLNVFLRPLDVKGTKMLTWTFKDKNDLQWLYLPSIRRAKKISARNQSASFMGSEFSYEDLGSQEVEKYNFKLLQTKKNKGHEIALLERTPKNKSGYSKQVVEMDKTFWNPVLIKYFNRRGEHLKTAIFSGYKVYKVNGKTFYRASTIHMKNHQTKKESIFKWTKRELGIKFKKRLFNKRSLK